MRFQHPSSHTRLCQRQVQSEVNSLSSPNKVIKVQRSASLSVPSKEIPENNNDENGN